MVCFLFTGTQVKSARAKLLQLSTYLSNQFMMTSDARSRVVEDTKLSLSELENQNLIIIGNNEENKWTETFLGRIPIKLLVNGELFAEEEGISHLLGLLLYIFTKNLSLVSVLIKCFILGGILAILSL